MVENLYQIYYKNIKVYVRVILFQKTHKFHNLKWKKNKDYMISMINFMHNHRITGEYNMRNLLMECNKLEN